MNQVGRDVWVNTIDLVQDQYIWNEIYNLDSCLVSQRSETKLEAYDRWTYKMNDILISQFFLGPLSQTEQCYDHFHWNQRTLMNFPCTIFIYF